MSTCRQTGRAVLLLGSSGICIKSRPEVNVAKVCSATCLMNDFWDIGSMHVRSCVRPGAAQVKPNLHTLHTPEADRQHSPPWLMLTAFPSPYGAILRELGSLGHGLPMSCPCRPYIPTYIHTYLCTVNIYILYKYIYSIYIVTYVLLYVYSMS